MSNRTSDHRLVAAAMDAAGDVGYEWDIASDRIRWIGPAQRLFAADDMAPFSRGETYNGRVNPEDLPYRMKCLSDHYRTRQGFDCEYRVRQGDGGFCWVHDRGTAERDKSGAPVRLRGVLRPVDARKQYEARLEHLANYDELTGHFNRTRLREALHQTLLHNQRYGLPGAYFSIGVDKVGLINDAYGYLTADAVIIAVGQRLERVIRGSDVLGRVGGDVYGLVLSHCPEPDLTAVAEKILRVFREHPIQTPSGPLHVTVSIGAAAFPGGGQSAHETMTQAEAALQTAKRQGRDCFSAYAMTDSQRSDHRRSMAVGEQVKAALKEHRLLLAFQPIVAAGDFSTRLYECLLRMRLPDGEIMAAGAFMPVVERLGLARIVDRRVLDLAVEELFDSPGISLSVNISGFTASDQAWLRRLVALVGTRPDVASRLVVEITETAAIQDIEETARFVATVRDLGCQVALDDFGAGFTSFRHLKALTVDIVKIDGSFVRNIAQTTDNRLFVRTLVGLAKGFGLRTIGECVETRADADALVAEGVDYLQGYCFGGPVTERPWWGGGVAPPLAIGRRG